MSIKVLNRFTGEVLLEYASDILVGANLSGMKVDAETLF
jgi:hypothetical protein